jgi:hypothetical protein
VYRQVKNVVLFILCLPSSKERNFSPQVEFPEAKIYEETLNALLYENRDTRPDAALMQATRGYTVGVNGYHSDDDVEDKVDRLRRK